MLGSKQAALLFIQLVKMGSVCAGMEQISVCDARVYPVIKLGMVFNTDMFSSLSVHLIPVYREVLVSRGEPVQLTYNISKTNLAMIQWKHGRSLFSYSISLNKTFSNFTPSRLITVSDTLTTLRILNVQHDDTGLYRCEITESQGLHIITWNLTITGNQTASQLLLFTLPPAIVLLFVLITSTICFYMKRRTRKTNPDRVQTQSQSQPEREIVSTQIQGSTDHWRNKRQRREYMERLNSIYDHI
ncbi:uncharacterized protein LOC108232409 isoform X2 [Kryptolebias marmoratus]|uniref:uncharacterized protein LOC108232409 isoform X2 n=1 Tax=Kryptolebias marmoratus TaxID=37003 RepID=UPI0018ACCFFA|nr:uncharacterized protein LOC108232409 isoform X2 [Kryptolebias marmoratus]